MDWEQDSWQDAKKKIKFFKRYLSRNFATQFKSGNQNKKSRSRRDMRRSHDALTTAAVSVDKASGETHLRHHVTADGYYRGRKVINK